MWSPGRTVIASGGGMEMQRSPSSPARRQNSRSTYCCRLAEALRTGRGVDDELVLSPAMLDLVARNHTGEMPNDILEDVFAGRNRVQCPAYLAMGFWGRGPGMTHGGFGHLTSPRTFGGLGRGSAMFWIDPLLDMTMTVLSTGLMDETDNFERLSALSDLAVSSLVDRTPFELFGAQIFKRR
jgi:CubicO group peptidase (beta-lactamase class C family)